MAPNPLFLIVLAPGDMRGSATTVLLVLGDEGNEQLTAALMVVVSCATGSPVSAGPRWRREGKTTLVGRPVVGRLSSAGFPQTWEGGS